jgi:hypothetical protein
LRNSKLNAKNLSASGGLKTFYLLNCPPVLPCLFTSLFEIRYSLFDIYPPQADLCAAGIIQFPPLAAAKHSEAGPALRYPLITNHHL